MATGAITSASKSNVNLDRFRAYGTLTCAEHDGHEAARASSLRRPKPLETLEAPQERASDFPGVPPARGPAQALSAVAQLAELGEELSGALDETRGVLRARALSEWLAPYRRRWA